MVLLNMVSLGQTETSHTGQGAEREQQGWAHGTGYMGHTTWHQSTHTHTLSLTHTNPHTPTPRPHPNSATTHRSLYLNTLVVLARYARCSNR